jgi:hypothetical protein
MQTETKDKPKKRQVKQKGQKGKSCNTRLGEGAKAGEKKYVAQDRTRRDKTR